MVSFNTGRVINQVHEALSESSERPQLTEEGTGGVYLIRRTSSEERESSGSDSPKLEPVAVFKPSDEEAGSANNPRGLAGDEHTMREGFRAGGGAIREVVAYKLDRGFAGVPPTAVDRLLMRTNTGTHLREQSGSIQQFVTSDGDASGYRFDGGDFDGRMCQRVALLDCRLFNCDRHEGNILVRPRRPVGNTDAATVPSMSGEGVGTAALDIVPIDHAFCLPAFGYFREAEFVWRYWRAAAQPFGPDAAEHVAAIDVDLDVEVARRAGLPEPSCATLRVCTMLVKLALRSSPPAHADAPSPTAAISLTPQVLGSMLMREQFDEPSPLEQLCARALGVPEGELGGDTALIDFVVAQPAAAGSYVPPPEFYARFAALLEERFGGGA